LEDHEVLERVVLVDDVAAQEVRHDRLAVERHLEADDVGLASVQLRLYLLGGEVAAVPVVARWELVLLLLLADGLQALRGAETAVGVAILDQPLRDLGVAVLALALDIRRVRAADVRPLIPLEPEPAEAVHQVLDRAFDESLAVGVLDAEDELARLALARCLPVGEEHVVHDEAGAADVQRAGRARGKADANLLEVLGDALRALGNS